MSKNKKRRNYRYKFKPHNIICPYCSQPATMTTGRHIYRGYQDAPYMHKLFYWCQPCDAYCGVHAGTNLPLGTLANAETRKWRMRVHAILDPLWRNKKYGRSEVYHKLAKLLGIEKKDCHVGMFNVEQCRKAITALQTLHQPGDENAELA